MGTNALCCIKPLLGFCSYAGQSQPLTVPPGSITDQGGGDVEYNDDFDSDTPPDGPPDEPELDDDPETPEDEHYEKPVEGPPGVAS